MSYTKLVHRTKLIKACQYTKLIQKTFLIKHVIELCDPNKSSSQTISYNYFIHNTELAMPVQTWNEEIQVQSLLIVSKCLLKGESTN
jgi:hypothetical protein